jgi:RHS repeat-associated protein
MKKRSWGRKPVGILPGQYYDAETGLHYNWNRYYDPEVGKYTQTDPLGFGAGDQNLYRYVGNGPSNLFDPLGLFTEGTIGGDDLSQYVDEPSSDSGGMETASMVLDFVPVVSEIKGLIEMVNGKDLLTGECLGKGRYLALLGPVAKVGKVAKIGVKAAKGVRRAKKTGSKLHTVYGLRNPATQEIEYIGRTVNPATRAINHANSIDKGHLEFVRLKEGLTYPQARGFEQRLFEKYGGFDQLLNKISPIRSNNPNYNYYIESTLK